MVPIKKNNPRIQNKLAASVLRSHLQTKFIGKNILVFDTATSTNELAKRLAKEGIQEGSLIIAEQQTRGRGRLKHAWHSPPKLGLWFSILLYPKHDHERLGLLSLLSGVAVREAIAELTPLQPALKWPNDVLINGKKAGGILLETEFTNARLAFLVLGIGVNVSQSIEDFPLELRGQATSLYMESGLCIERAVLLNQILLNLEENYAHFQTRNFEIITDKWKRRCPFFKNNISIRQNGEEIAGIFEELDTMGRMLIRLPSGETRCIHSSD